MSRNEDLLAKCRVGCMEDMLADSRLRWLRHLGRMDESRLPRRMLNARLAVGTRKAGRPKTSYLGVVQEDLKSMSLGRHTWLYWCDKERRTEWRAMLKERVLVRAREGILQ